MVSRRQFLVGSGMAATIGLSGCLSKTISTRDAAVAPSATLFTDVTVDGSALKVSVTEDLKMEIGSKYNGTAEIIGVNVPATGYTRHTQAFLGSSNYRFELPTLLPERVYCLAKSKTGDKDDYMQAERVTVEIADGTATMVSGHEYRKNYIITD